MHKVGQSDVLIIGAGPVGLFAAFKAGMLGMKSIVVDSLSEIGGQCSALYPEKPIYDIPAYPKIFAQDLVQNLKKQASVFNPQYYLNHQITSIQKNGDGLICTSSQGTEFRAKIVIIAAGAGAFGPNKPPISNITQYENQSVFYQIDRVDKFHNKNIVIAGGGDSAIDWAINLADTAKHIYLIHRRERFRASPANIDQIYKLRDLGKIDILIPYQLSALDGEGCNLNSVRITSTDGREKVLEADILLSFFGLNADLGPLKNWGIEIKNNSIRVDQSTQMTNIEGVYAVGDICHYPGKLKLILVGFSECAVALHHCYPRVFGGKMMHFKHSTSMDTNGFFGS